MLCKHGRERVSIVVAKVQTLLAYTREEHLLARAVAFSFQSSSWRAARSFTLDSLFGGFFETGI
eukprot:scaffold5373_cov94-Skeletonema_marinoi.AAC.1